GEKRPDLLFHGAHDASTTAGIAQFWTRGRYRAGLHHRRAWIFGPRSHRRRGSPRPADRPKRSRRPIRSWQVGGLTGSSSRPGAHADAHVLLAMAGELRHRGPDGTGLYLDGRLGMANTRLAIVDLEGGDQPLSCEHGRYWAMQNGEIYNYVEL